MHLSNHFFIQFNVRLTEEPPAPTPMVSFCRNLSKLLKTFSLVSSTLSNMFSCLEVNDTIDTVRSTLRSLLAPCLTYLPDLIQSTMASFSPFSLAWSLLPVHFPGFLPIWTFIQGVDHLSSPQHLSTGVPLPCWVSHLLVWYFIPLLCRWLPTVSSISSNPRWIQTRSQLVSPTFPQFLQLNLAKTELLVFPTNQLIPHYIWLLNSHLVSCSCHGFWNLGVIIDDQLRFSSHVASFSQSSRFAWYNTREISYKPRWSPASSTAMLFEWVCWCV